MINTIFESVKNGVYFECYFEGFPVIVSSREWFEMRIFEQVPSPCMYEQEGKYYIFIPYDSICNISSPDILEAILYHEIGHIKGEYPGMSSTDLREQTKYELAADRYMIKHASNPKVLIQVLQGLLDAILINRNNINSEYVDIAKHEVERRIEQLRVCKS